MPWITFTTRARQELRQLDRQTASRIVAALERFAEIRHGDVRKLQGRAGEMRLRVGDWRVLFEYGDDGETVVVLRVLPRGRAYRD